MALPPRVYQFLVGVFASLGSILFGYDLGVIAEVVGSDSFLSTFNSPDANQTGLVVSLFTAGAFAGAFFGGPFGDKLGRRWTIVIGSVIFCLGGGLQTGARNIKYLWAGRFCAGIGVGLETMIIPLYQAEISHPSIRGAITSLQQFMLGIGALAASWISYGTFVGFAPTDNAQWRVSLGIQLVPAVILGCLIMIFPESPRWLIDHGRPEKGIAVLAQLHAHGDQSDPWVLAEFDQIQESITYEHEHEAKSYQELVRSKSSRRRLLLSMALQASVQMTGVSAIQYYSVKIYGQIGISPQDSLKYQAINSIIALIAQALCIAFIDRFGRRWPLIYGNLGNCVTFVIATILLARFPPTANAQGAHWGFIIVTWIYNFSFSATCGPLSWIIPAEIFDTRTRAKGVSLATMTSFGFNTMIGQVTPIALNHVGWRYYILFVVCNFTNAIFFWATLPETRKVPLEEMNELFEKAPLFVPGSEVTTIWQSGDLERRAEGIEREKEGVEHEEKI